MSTVAFAAARFGRVISALPWLACVPGIAVALVFPRVAAAQVSVGGGASGAVTTPAPAPAPAPAPELAPAPAVAPAAAPVAAPAEAGGVVGGVVAEAPQTEEEREWAARDRSVNESSTLTGGVGLLHVQHAQSLAPGQFAVGFTTEYFSAGFLCTPSFPCARPGGGTVLTSDSLDHIGGTLTLTAALTKFLEAYGGTSAYANSDGANRPSLLQVLGDTDLGLKLYGPVGKILHVGGAAELWLVNGTGAVGLDGSGTSGKFRGLVTADLRGSDKHTPLRFSINGTYTLDNTGQVIAATETARGTSITRVERFGLGVNRVDHFDVGIGAEAFLVNERVRPFVEYNILIPVNRQNYLCRANNISGDNCLANDALAPSKLTLGGRFFPWRHGFGLTAAFDIGITGQNDFIEEVSPIPPWTLYLGAGWAIDTQDRPPVVQTKIVEHAVETAAPEGHIKGYVHEAGKPEVGVPSAIVSYVNHAELTPLATMADGHFNTLGLPAGQYDFKVSADGYRDGVCSAVLNLNAQNEMPPMATEHEAAPPPHGSVVDAAVDCALEALPKVGKIVGHVRTADKSPVGNASLKLSDSLGHEFTGVADGNGVFHFDGMAPGPYKLEVNAPEYMTDIESVEVKARAETSADVVLMKSPNLVKVTAKEIIIKQQIQFAFDSATILPESTGLLTEIADVFIKSPQLKKVEIQGHTDSEGPDDHNQKLSEDRANSVRDWLERHGVPGDRVTAVGYGEKKPIVPNVTAANRAKNRRVQFIIMAQDKVEKTAPAPSAPATPASTPAAKPEKPKTDPGF